MKILLVCGQASAIQGWGNMETTEKMKCALESYGHWVVVLYVESNEELIRHIKYNEYDLVWSSIYYFTDNIKCINNINEKTCVMDILREMGVAYVGANAEVMKNMINKKKTIELLEKYGLSTHQQYVLEKGSAIPKLDFTKKWFVKPCFESESNGVSEKSIVHNEEELNERVQYILENYNQHALVEEYLSGDEYTTAIIGNKEKVTVLPIKNVVSSKAYERYPVITQNLKTDKMLSFEIPYDEMEELNKLAIEAAKALGVCDTVRIDIRKNESGEFRVIELNGIPGLNPIKSRIFEIYNLYNPQNSKEQNYAELVNKIVIAAKERYNEFVEGKSYEEGKDSVELQVT
ncbi:ATP-grasp domain-containing protein [Clostridium cellulovorans]|uniref:D-alanine--D-alanine ligase domain protein n=1 Tax=Clostridium cellulovorans (strain ATCC 35296 / DSM 3052 / OCM 3 / 743B) TaxID=573061 RepID=D9STT1_CLOC7|nr:ATP-grasp domain-containing protein [Clostridium cellulovorans]ADL52815.1 D-alanine--D-alanine ligase domain protein [Clostridium cellulovorans 743B]